MNTANDASDDFAYLIFGLKRYFDKNRQEIPQSLRRALNRLSFRKGEAFPKTLASFLELCHQAPKWYPMPVPDYDMRQPILYENALSEEAHEFYLNMLDTWSMKETDELSQDILDNARMIELRQKLRAMPDPQEAQTIYEKVRSFLIEHSLAHLEAMREEPKLSQHIMAFYEDEEIPKHFKELKICPVCGILRWHQGQWQGIKPSYCHEHESSAKLQSIPNTGQLYRLRPIIHERVFLPGQLEKALFSFAESLVDEVYLLKSERYPGLDASDLRLSFSDGENWAIDAKDQAKPRRLGREIKMPFGEGSLAYSHAFYVLPDERMEDEEYRESLEYNRQVREPNLFVLSLSEFKEQLEAKLKKLAKPLRKSKKD